MSRKLFLKSSYSNASTSAAAAAASLCWLSSFKSASSALFWRSVLARLSLRVSATLACCFLNKTSVSAYFNFTRAACTWARFQASSTEQDWEIAADLSEDAFCFTTMSGFNTFFGSMTKQHLLGAVTNRIAFPITRSICIQNVQYTYNYQGKRRTNNLYFQKHSGIGQHINSIPEEEEEKIIKTNHLMQVPEFILK